MSTEGQRRKAAQREGYPGYRPSRLLHQEGKLGGEPMDGIDFVSDDLHEQRVFAAMKADWTEMGDIRDSVHADVIDTASAKADAWDCEHDDRFLGLKQVPVVKTFLDRVMADVHQSDPHTWHAPSMPVVHDDGSPAGVGISPPYWDSDKADSYRVLVGVLASSPQRVHVLRAGYTPAVWLAEASDRSHSCAWHGPNCADYTRTLLAFARGNFLVAIPTCHFCEGWLLDGAPTTVA